MASSIFRSRLAKEFDERTARFHTSIVEDIRIFDEDIDGTEAHDIMLHEQGVIPLRSLKLILKALEEIRSEWHGRELQISPEFEDIHEYIEKRVIDKIGLESGGMIHTGRSRNDQVVVDIRMKTRAELLDVAERILILNEALYNLAEKHVYTIMMMYTHGQHAQVGTFAHYLLSYADALSRDFKRVMECYSRVNKNPLGAGPIGGTSIKINRERTAELLGFDGLVENSIDATSGRDWAIEVASISAILMTNLSRICSDFIEWSTREFNYIELADEYASSSSIMPQKKNPSTLELIRGKSGETNGILVELLTMVKGVQSGYSQDLQGTKPPLWRCFDTVKTSLEIMAGIISTLKVNSNRMEESVKEGLTAAVELAERLVTEKTISFRESYKLVAALVRHSVERGGKLSELQPETFSAISEETIGREIKIDANFMKESADAKSILSRRQSRGSPNPDEMKRMLEDRKRRLKEDHALLNHKRMIISKSKELLRETVAKYISL
ncbi:MAG: argininosuccinate lyase [Candidatus Bathyarchaeia archaeon]